MNVDVCLCTFRRPSVADTFASLREQRLPDGVHLRVIVADNDATHDRARLVSAGEGLDLMVLHAPARNISLARNATLDAATAEFVAVLDDDEHAAPDWIARLLARQAESGADVVLGPVAPVYGAAPAWMREADTHATRPVFVGGAIITGYTSNVLFRRTAPALEGLRFRLDLGVTGGEDTEFFTRAHRAGATFAYAPDAVVTEPVEPQRATLRWLLRRRWRAGQSHATALAPAGPLGRAAESARAGAKLAVCAAAAVATLPSPRHRGAWLLRGALHAGALSRLAGARTLAEYGAPDARA